MKTNAMKGLNLITILSLLLSACVSSKPMDKHLTNDDAAYTPASQELFDLILMKDSLLFEAYNTCKLEVFDQMLSDDMEFYHDKGGLTTSKQQVIEALKNNICGKVTRQLVPGSVEVYPIPGYGAVQLGQHRFRNNQEPAGIPSKPGRFVHIWQEQNGKWRITRVVSLH